MRWLTRTWLLRPLPGFWTERWHINDCLQVTGGARKDASRWARDLGSIERIARDGPTGSEHEGTRRIRGAQDGGTQGSARVQELPGISGDAVHIGQFRGGARNPVEVAAA